MNESFKGFLESVGGSSHEHECVICYRFSFINAYKMCASYFNGRVYYYFFFFFEIHIYKFIVRKSLLLHILFHLKKKKKKKSFEYSTYY